MRGRKGWRQGAQEGYGKRDGKGNRREGGRSRRNMGWRDGRKKKRRIRRFCSD